MKFEVLLERLKELTLLIEEGEDLQSEVPPDNDVVSALTELAEEFEEEVE